VFGIPVHAPRYKAGICPPGKRQRIEGMVDTSERSRFRYFFFLGSRRILALGQPVDLVIEKEDIDIEIAAQQVNGVIAADAEAVAVARYNPNAELGARRLQTGGDGRGATMYRMHAIRVHVIRKPAAATDA